jgi:hypothetical protein
MLGHTPEEKMGGSGGAIEVDESFVGGDPKNWHIKKRVNRKRFTDHDVKVKSEKVAVVGLLDRDARQVKRCGVVRSRSEGNGRQATDLCRGYRQGGRNRASVLR